MRAYRRRDAQAARVRVSRAAHGECCYFSSRGESQPQSNSRVRSTITWLPARINPLRNDRGRYLETARDSRRGRVPEARYTTRAHAHHEQRDRRQQNRERRGRAGGCRVRGGLISKKLSEKEPRDESCGSKPRSTALRAHVGRRTMSSRERKGGEGQEVVCFVTCRVRAYYVYELLQTKYSCVQVGYE